jgi:hypothetical protein
MLILISVILDEPANDYSFSRNPPHPVTTPQMIPDSPYLMFEVEDRGVGIEDDSEIIGSLFR